MIAHLLQRFGWKGALLRLQLEGALERRKHWEKTSHSLLVGVILHVLYAERDKTLAGVANFLADPQRTIEATLRAMMTTRHLGDKVHPVVASAARELLTGAEAGRLLGAMLRLTLDTSSETQEVVDRRIALAGKGRFPDPG